MVRLAIVGAGGMANTHAQNFGSIPGCKIVAVCDTVPNRAAQFAEKHKIPKHFTDLDEMLGSLECDAVAVVTSDAGHAPVSLKCIAGRASTCCAKSRWRPTIPTRRRWWRRPNRNVSST